MGNSHQDIPFLHDLTHRWATGQATPAQALDGLSLWEDDAANRTEDELDAAWELRQKLERSLEGREVVAGSTASEQPIHHAPGIAIWENASPISQPPASAANLPTLTGEQAPQSPQLRGLVGRLVAARKRRAWGEFNTHKEEIEQLLAAEGNSTRPQELSSLYGDAEEAQEADALIVDAIEARKRGNFPEAASLLAGATGLDPRAPRLSTEQQLVADLNRIVQALRANPLSTAQDLSEAARLCDQLLDDDAAPESEYALKRRAIVVQSIEKKVAVARRYLEEGEGALARSQSVEDKLDICITMEEKLSELATLQPDSPDLPALRFRLNSLRRQLEQERASGGGFTPSFQPGTNAGSVSPPTSAATPNITTPSPPLAPRRDSGDTGGGGQSTVAPRPSTLPPPLPRPIAVMHDASPASQPQAGSQTQPQTISAPRFTAAPPPAPPKVQGYGFEASDMQSAPTQAQLGKVYRVPFASAEQTGWGFWLQWTGGTILGLMGGLLLTVLLFGGYGYPLGALRPIVVLSMGASMGLASGTFQWLVLRHREINHVGWWVPTSTLGWAVGALGEWVLSRSQYNAPVWIFLTLAAGGLLGIIQWLMLARQVDGAGWWVVANALGWAPLWALLSYYPVSYYYYGGRADLYNYDLLYIPVGAAITGAVIAWLLRRRIA